MQFKEPGCLTRLTRTRFSNLFEVKIITTSRSFFKDLFHVLVYQKNIKTAELVTESA